jgi:hypothetical protein
MATAFEPGPRVLRLGFFLIGCGFGDFLGFTTPRSVSKQSKSVGGFGAAFLLKLGNPIRYRCYHIARRFAGGICLRAHFHRAFLLALLNDSDCFFLRHLINV